MGITLVPVNTSAEILEYNWEGWRFLLGCLEDWGVDTEEFSDRNDGDRLSATTCRVVASAIEHHLKDLSPEDENWLKGHIAVWRLSDGFEQR